RAALAGTPPPGGPVAGIRTPTTTHTTADATTGHAPLRRAWAAAGPATGDLAAATPTGPAPASIAAGADPPGRTDHQRLRRRPHRRPGGPGAGRRAGVRPAHRAPSAAPHRLN